MNRQRVPNAPENTGIRIQALWT